MNTKQVIELARKHIPTAIQEGSARVCLEDAVKLYDAGDLINAKIRAVKSLGYSIGVFHRDYQRARA